MEAVVTEAERAGVPVRWVNRDAIEGFGLADHQGVVAILRSSFELNEEDLVSMSLPQDALVVVLDGVVDPQNLGACARAAEAAGAAVLVSRKRRAAPVSTAAVRASAGALLHLAFARVPNLVRVIEHLKRRGFFVVGLDADAVLDIHAAPPAPRPLAVVVGSEGRGMSRLVRESCDLLIAIPLAGRISSLNASAALAVGLFGYALRPAAGGDAAAPRAATMPPRWRGAVR